MGAGVTDYLLAGHHCRPVARMSMAAERDWWLGELTEPLAEWPNETHCLHITTPLKTVVLGINRGDMTQLAVLAQIVHGGPISPAWIDRMESTLRARATAMEERV